MFKQNNLFKCWVRETKCWYFSLGRPYVVGWLLFGFLLQLTSSRSCYYLILGNMHSNIKTSTFSASRGVMSAAEYKNTKMMQKEFASPTRNSYHLLVEQENSLYEASKVLSTPKDVDTWQNKFHNEDFSVRSVCSSFRPVPWEGVSKSTLGLTGGHRKVFAVSHCISVFDTLSHT